MWKFSNLLLKIIFILLLVSVWIFPQKKELNNPMPEFYRDNIDKPLKIDISPVNIKPVQDIHLSASHPGEYNGGYFFRYLNSMKNSRLLSEFKPDKIWEIKWQSPLDSNLYPWFLLTANDHIIVQNESGWQMFNTNGKLITSSARMDGNLSIDFKNNLFYQNDFSGFLAANNLTTGQTEFFVYPYFGKGYERSNIWYNENKFLTVGYELPVMTHKAPPKEPDITLFEVIDVQDKSLIDSDKILNSAQQVQKLILKAKDVKIASSGGLIVAASDNFISVIDQNLNVKKIFHGEFIPEEISLDEQLNIYLTVKVNDEKNDSFKFDFWVLNQNGEVINETELPVQDENSEFYPPILGFDGNTFILMENRLVSIDPAGGIKWDSLLAGSSPGASITENGYLLTSEGDLLCAFNKTGERNFIFQFESEELYTPPILTPDNEIYVATKNFLYCLTPKN
jgi:hypothetical protein